jgi:membrane-associated phospholipid phosphatase
MAISLWASTIYLRHHWSLDIIFGWILGLMSVLVARYLTTLVAPEPDFSGTKRNRTT